MSRVASLDFLRGMAAFAVALPHYLTLNATDQPAAEAMAIAAVEIFFVLSGFVLAPQILDRVMNGPPRHLRVFLMRRWMRTVPPYLVALVCVSVITGQLLTLDFARYAVYAQNVFFQANAHDYFPIAWSLAVEEWFYVTFAPLLYLIARRLGGADRRTALLFAVGFIATIVALRAFGPSEHWDAEVRRVTVFRIDSIAWGFLLYIVMEKRAPIDIGATAGRVAVAAGLLVVIACCAACVWFAYRTLAGDTLAKLVFPFAATAAGVAAVAFFRLAEQAFAGRIVSALSIYLGGVSYSVYLFHIILVMTLKPKLASLPLLAQLVVYLLALIALTTAFWIYFEKPILAARPRYDEDAAKERLAVNSGREAVRAFESP